MIKKIEPTVLIIEDNKMFRDLAFDVFEHTNRIMAKDAEEGLEKFKEYMPEITLLDIGLPDKSGLELLPEIIKYNPESFVIMMTQSNLQKDVKLAKSLGAKCYISKPFSFNKVAECMKLYKQHKAELDTKSEKQRFHKEQSTEFIKEVAKEIEKVHNKELEKEETRKHGELIEKEIAKLSLLFVDDYPANRFKAKQLFSKMGCSVDTAKSGMEAVEKYKKQKFNIILMDSNMKGMSGYESSKKIRAYETAKNLKKSTIIGMLEYDDEVNNKLWKKAKMDDYITKPAKILDVKEILKKHIENHLKESV